MAQYYTRIVNPYMPNGTVELTNAPSPAYAPGEIGCVFNDQNGNGSYLRVYVDSGATSATPVGAVAIGQLAFWKDRANSLVTNDKRMSDVGTSGAINRVAGVFQVAATVAPGVNGSDGNPLLYYVDLVVSKKAYPVAATGTIVAGAVAIADTTASVSRVISAATVTTAPVSQVIGICTTAVLSSGNTTPVDVNIGFVE